MTQLFSKKASLWFRGLAIIMVLLSHYAEWWEWFTPSEGNAELWRQAFSRLGPYGVAIFFLFSGYGLVLSLGEKKMSFVFIGKRLLGVYLPYLIVVGIIEALSGGFSDLRDFWQYLNGHDYWFMVVLFLFYIGFICIWAIPVNQHVHTLLFVLFTGLMYHRLHRAGNYSFWYISNPAFAAGVVLAVYQPFFRKLLDSLRSLLLVILTAGMAISVYFALFSPATAFWTPEKHINCELAAVSVWTLLVICLASDLHRFDPVLPFLGTHSLYLYLTHQFIFMKVINSLTEYSFRDRFLIAADLTLAVSLATGILITFLTRKLTFPSPDRT